MRKVKTIISLIFVTILSFYPFFEIKASPETIEFVDDRALELTNPDLTIYVASGSRADSLTISGNTLNVTGVPAGSTFLLKSAPTATPPAVVLLKVVPSGGSVNFTVSSADYVDGAFTRWQTETTVLVDYTIGGLDPNANYTVYFNGSFFGTFLSNENGEITFTRTGGGVIELFELKPDYKVKFVDDTALELTNPDLTIYVASGSRADSLTISGNTLNVTGVPVGSTFLLKSAPTATPPAVVLLKVVPSGGSVNFTVSSADYVDGAFTRWQTETTASVDYTIGGLNPNIYYPVSLNGSFFGTFLSNENGEITFTRTGGGVMELFEIKSFYGIDLNYALSPREIKGFTWSDLVLGWASFNRSNCDSNKDGLTDTGNYSGCPIGQAISDYRVFTRVYFLRAINLTHEWHYCHYDKAPVLKWEVQGGTQSKIRLQISTTGDFSSPVFDTGITNWSYNQFPAYARQWGEGEWPAKWTAPHPIYGSTYHWQLKIGDVEGNWSPWAYGGTFTLPSHAFAKAAFSLSPSSPSVDEEVQFNNLTDYDEIQPVTWEWTITPATGLVCINPPDCPCTVSNCFQPRVKFTVIEQKTIRLRATTNLTEEDLYSGAGCGLGCCRATRSLTVQYPLPLWREVIPK